MSWGFLFFCGTDPLSRLKYLQMEEGERPPGEGQRHRSEGGERCCDVDTEPRHYSRRKEETWIRLKETYCTVQLCDRRLLMLLFIIITMNVAQS